MLTDLLQPFQGIDITGGILLTLNVLLILLAPAIIHFFNTEESQESSSFTRKVRILRAINLLFILILLFRIFGVSASSPESSGWFLKAVGVLAILYFAYLMANIAGYLIVRHYGQEKEIEGIKRRVPNYPSRLIGIFSSIFIAVIALISIVQLVEQDHLLKAGGVIGFMGVFLALTQSTWAPDIFSGLIILNSNMLEEGDIVEVNDGDGKIYGLVYKTRVFHTVILDLINNHRVMIRNSRLRDFTVHNLSKFSSAKGLREMLSFKIGYKTRISEIHKLFDEAFARAAKNADINIEYQHGHDTGIHDAGDHAVEWRIYYYTKAVDQLPRIRRQLMQEILLVSRELEIELSTPLTHIIEKKPSQ